MSDRRKKLLAAFQSPIGKKITTGITGLGLTIFVIIHMTGNLSYFSSDAQAYNKYSHFLTEGLGALFYLIEIGLLAFFVFHIITGIQIYLGKRRARNVGYDTYRSSGKPSMQTLSSRTMIVTGLILLVFLVIHLWSFKYGPGIDEGYVVTVDGEPIRDLKRLMAEKFQEPLYAFGYPFVMLLLGFHLRHGIWSAFQSLGAMNPRLTPLVYGIGGLLAVLIAVGFLVLPLYIFFSA
jgi:succinate dehydrogenase / fumarate reductase cytochrome b subunit